jgi:hypothetical protein
MAKKLILTPQRFYTLEDEDLFFSWINKINCVKDYTGIGKELHVNILSGPITFNDYNNLYGLFKRYKLKNIEQLKTVFLTKKNKDWFDK